MADGPTDVTGRAVRCWLLLWAALWSVALSVASANSVTVVAASDLSADMRLVVSGRMPLMLVITREDCGYCDLLKRAVINPMILSGEYQDRVIIREISIDRPTTLVDFSGREVSPFAVADSYDAFLTPAVLLVGPKGAELHDRLLGISNEDMYLFYLDQAIERATERLHRELDASDTRGLDQGQ